MEHNKRIQKAKELTKLETGQALLITSYANIFYLSGFTSCDATLLITKDEQYLLTDSRYTIAAKAEAPDFIVSDKPNALYALCRELAIQTILYEGSVSVNTFSLWQSALPAMTFQNISTALAPLRCQKTEEEISCISHAADICDAAFANVLNRIRPGVTEKQLSLWLEFDIRSHGASDVSFDTIVATGARSAMPHATPTDTPVKEGDFLLFDFGALYKGYCSDITRTVVVGTPSDDQINLYQTVLSAQLAAIDAIAIGKRCCDIDKVARDIIAAAGHQDHFGHALGHSVGVEIHESPTFSPRCETPVQEGLVITVEPGIYLENFGGVRIEDTVAVTKGGVQILTKTGKKLNNI